MVNYVNLTDQDLFILLKNGDSLAYTEIFERYQGVLYSHAFRLLGDHVEVQDVIQDVFLHLWQKRETLDVKTNLSSYLYSAVRNGVFNVMSHQKVVGRYTESLNHFWEEGEYSTDKKIREQELNQVINQEIVALPEKMRQVFLLSRNGNVSYKQIGEQLNISEKTVRNQVYNAVHILKVKISSFLTIFPFL
ncbi:RNA polymerase sigma-70 factor, ECF subfamily [bacterium A37T11]|nr:RNA polymerase sigma-70 factor, ECF subfamily [bacterium A37T11]